MTYLKQFVAEVMGDGKLFEEGKGYVDKVYPKKHGS